MSHAILFHFLCAQHVWDISISIIRSLRLFYWITTLVVLFLVRCVLEFRCGGVGVVSVLQAEAQLVLQPAPRILMPEIRRAHKKWNKIASGIKLVFCSSAITMMHGPMNLRYLNTLNYVFSEYARYVRRSWKLEYLCLSIHVIAVTLWSYS